MCANDSSIVLSRLTLPKIRVPCLHPDDVRVRRVCISVLSSSGNARCDLLHLVSCRGALSYSTAYYLVHFTRNHRLDPPTFFFLPVRFHSHSFPYRALASLPPFCLEDYLSTL